MRLLFASGTSDNIAVGGVVTALVTMGGYLLKELNKASGGAWRVVREKNSEMHYLRWERDMWRAKALGQPDVPPYKPPTEQELKTL